MRLSDFDFSLPPEFIAQQPLPDRDGARMLVVDRGKGSWEDRHFRDLPTYLSPGDCLVLNNSRVIPSRLLGRRVKDGQLLDGAVEIFLTKPESPDMLVWKALVNPGKKMPIGQHVRISDDLSAEVLARGEFGERTVRLTLREQAELFQVLEQVGHVPLPPYIRRTDQQADRERYQTVFANQRGSVAAPTAGLHFTPSVLDACRAAGASTAEVTLHVGLGTFAPLRTDILDEVQLHHESFTVPPDAVAAMNQARRVVAVGTTSVRAIESAARSAPGATETDLFIRPGFQFQRTGAMLTNFHLPKSSLLVLVSAFGGTDLMLAAYQHAVQQKYRFFSYGDCMLII